MSRKLIIFCKCISLFEVDYLGNINVREYVNHSVHKQLTNNDYITYKNCDGITKGFWMFTMVLCGIFASTLLYYIITMVHEFLYHDKYIPSLYQCTLCNGFHAYFNCKSYHGTIMSFRHLLFAFFKVLWCVM